MKAAQKNLIDILGAENTQFMIPIFQRVYSWTQEQCVYLFDDIVCAGKSGREHFAGAFLYLAEPESPEGYRRFQIVDGQQRMTTLTLMLIALCDHVRGLPEKSGESECRSVPDGISIAKKYLFAGDKGNALKLQLTSIDRDMLEYVMGAGEKPEDISSQIQTNLDIFRSKMNSRDFDLEIFWRGLGLLSVIELKLDDDDSPQLIFESINSKGKRLNIEDLVRNSILMQSGETVNEKRSSTDVFTELWEPMEQAMDDVGDATMNDMICCWLASRHGNARVKSEDDIYMIFKGTLEAAYGGSYADFLKDLKEYSETFISNPDLRKDAIKMMGKWRSGTPRGSLSQYKLFGD